MIRRTLHGSVKSPHAKSIAPEGRCARFTMYPCERQRAKTVTRSAGRRARSKSTKCEPQNPVAPVTQMFIDRAERGSAGLPLGTTTTIPHRLDVESSDGCQLAHDFAHKARRNLLAHRP